MKPFKTVWRESSMQAVVIDEPGGLDVLKEKELPLPKPGPYEVRIKIKAIGLNPVDYKIRSGLYNADTFPLFLGADCSGTIDAVGDRHGEFSVGEEVYALCFIRCSNGAYAEYVCLPAQFVAKKPKHFSFEEAAAVPVAYLTAFQALIGTSCLQQERPLFITGGSGGVGSAAISIAKCYKGGPIFATAGSEKSAASIDIPADQIFRYDGLTLKEMIKKVVEKGRFYLTLDLVGGRMKELCFAITDFNGHIVSVLPEETDFPIPIWGRKSPLFGKSQSMHFVYVGAPASSSEAKDWVIYKTRLDHLRQLFDRGALAKPKVEVIGPLSAETVRRGHERLEGGHTHGKLVLSL